MQSTKDGVTVTCRPVGPQASQRAAAAGLGVVGAGAVGPLLALVAVAAEPGAAPATLGLASLAAATLGEAAPAPVGLPAVKSFLHDPAYPRSGSL
jgi:hypothetical protein